jgi:hypothetical protein
MRVSLLIVISAAAAAAQISSTHMSTVTVAQQLLPPSTDFAAALVNIHEDIERRAQHECASEGDWHVMVGVVAAALNNAGWNIPNGGHTYEFGIFTGGSMRAIHRLLRPTMMWGFDSFEGLPEYSTDKNATSSIWTKGMYSADPRAALTKEIGQGAVDFVQGFYDQSLTSNLVAERGMRPAQYIGIDCDLYESAETSLTWAFQAGVAVPGTLVGYDDWWVVPCIDGHGDPMAVGEGRAHREVSERFDVEFVCVAGPCNSKAAHSPTTPPSSSPPKRCGAYHTWGPVFLVLSIGQGRANTGFDMTTEDVSALRVAMPWCVLHAQKAAKAAGGAAKGGKGVKKKQARKKGH